MRFYEEMRVQGLGIEVFDSIKTAFGEIKFNWLNENKLPFGILLRI